MCTVLLPPGLVPFCVLFVCNCALYCCHRVSTQFQLTNTPSYHFLHQLIDQILKKVMILNWSSRETFQVPINAVLIWRDWVQHASPAILPIFQLSTNSVLEENVTPTPARSVHPSWRHCVGFPVLAILISIHTLHVMTNMSSAFLYLLRKHAWPSRSSFSS